MNAMFEFLKKGAQVSMTNNTDSDNLLKKRNELNLKFLAMSEDLLQSKNLKIKCNCLKIWETIIMADDAYAIIPQTMLVLYFYFCFECVRKKECCFFCVFGRKKKKQYNANKNSAKLLFFLENKTIIAFFCAQIRTVIVLEFCIVFNSKLKHCLYFGVIFEISLAIFANIK